MFLEEVLLCARNPISPLLRRAVGWISVEFQFMGSGLVCCPWPEVDVRRSWEWREVLDLAVLLGGLLNVEMEGEECMWPPWDCPVSCEGGGAGQRGVNEGIVNHIA